ncbi:hypothetical protein D6029_19895 [Buttiauxella izardii]|uniref:Uncharacterized protein n=1 Tax=Buttiauxella izardii TaxID=82991 RepID=A0A3A5JM65_9ENTR|nr:hypothetical protein D6029_19895 [Buttiauxella izardii]
MYADSHVKTPASCRRFAFYSSYFKPQPLWLRSFTSVTYFSKLLRIHSKSALLQLELFRVRLAY